MTEAMQPECERVEERRGMLRAIAESARDAAGHTGRPVLDARVLEAVVRVPRHEFVPPALQDSAYANVALPIGHGQTISQPFIVALMTDLAAPGPDAAVLEVGTGCGYQTAVLAELARKVWSIELVAELAESAAARLERLGYANAVVRTGDGADGWPEHAPFDAILVTAAPDHVPPALVEQLAVGGCMVLPLGDWNQDLVRLRKTEQGVERETLLPVRFVPMRGAAERESPAD
jgi:protein-L-isoaspartate(D-aspartate) O-methyltransferase